MEKLKSQTAHSLEDKKGQNSVADGADHQEPDIIECLQDYQLMLTAIAQRHKNQKQRVGAFNKGRAVKQLIERLIDLEKEEDATIPA